MANSRLEKLGSIFSRITSLMKCGAMKPDDKPIWYEVYQTFPPFDEPSYSRRVNQEKIKEIFYPEDSIRAKFHQGLYAQRFMVENLREETTTNITRRVISLTYELMENDKELTEDEALKKAIDKLGDRHEKRSKSMFKSTNRKFRSVLTENEVVDVPSHSGPLKTIAQKNVDVDSILNKEGEGYIDSFAEDFKEDSENKSSKKKKKNDTPEEK